MGTMLRKYQSDLVTGGVGVLMFGLWDIIKIIMMYSFMPEQYGHELDSLPEPVAFFCYFLIFFLVFFTIAFFHVYVGVCAIAEGTNGKGTGGLLYILISFVLAITAISEIFIVLIFPPPSEAPDSIIVSFIVSLTATYMYLQIAYAGIRVRRICGSARSKD